MESLLRITFKLWISCPQLHVRTTTLATTYEVRSLRQKVLGGEKWEMYTEYCSRYSCTLTGSPHCNSYITTVVHGYCTVQYMCHIHAGPVPGMVADTRVVSCRLHVTVCRPRPMRNAQCQWQWPMLNQLMGPHRHLGLALAPPPKPSPSHGA